MRQPTIYVCIVVCVAGGTGCNNNQSTMPILKTPETQEPEDWVEAGKQPFQGDNVEVRVIGVRCGRPRVRELKAGEQPPAGKLLIVYLELRNLSRTKRISHLSWAKSDGAFVARLQDEQSVRV